jgi:hypothetical protein
MRSDVDLEEKYKLGYRLADCHLQSQQDLNMHETALGQEI